MSRAIFLPLAVLVILALPFEAIGQVNPPTLRSPSGELVELHYWERYRQRVHELRRDRMLARTDKLLEFNERNAAYAADACGIGCEGHEGLQVRRIPGTDLAAVLYKALRDDEVVTVQLRFHNDGDRAARLTLDPRDPAQSFFVQVGDRALPILRDDDGEMEAKGALDELLDPGEVESWWARFPMPRGPTTFDLHIPGVTFEDVPLETD